MRKSRLLFTLLCGVMLTIVTNSCSDDNSGSGEWNEDNALLQGLSSFFWRGLGGRHFL